MQGYQQTILLGHLTKDPEIRATPRTGKKTARFTVAVTREWKDYDTKLKRSKTDYIPVTAWESLADIAEAYLRKGQLVHVTGELRSVPFSKANKITVLTLAATGIVMLGFPKRSRKNQRREDIRTWDESGIDRNDPLESGTDRND